MGKLKVSIVFFFIILSFFSFANEIKKPVALGSRFDRDPIIHRILIPEGIEYVVFDDLFSIEEYNKFSVIIFIGKINKPSDEQLKKIKNYLEGGGIIILFATDVIGLSGGRDLKIISDITGFGFCGRGKQIEKKVKILNKNSPVFANLKKEEYDWASGYEIPEITNVSSAKILAVMINEKGDTLSPFITMNEVGKGKVYWFGIDIFRLYQTKPGWNEEAENYRKVILNAILEGKPAVRKVKKEEWIPKPLGGEN